MWMAPAEIVPDKERRTMESPKLVPTVVWHRAGFQILKALPKGREIQRPIQYKSFPGSDLRLTKIGWGNAAEQVVDPYRAQSNEAGA
jgi:hypothetical protein